MIQSHCRIYIYIFPETITLKYSWNFSHKKINQEKPRENQEFRFISDIRQDLTEIFSNGYFIENNLVKSR